MFLKYGRNFYMTFAVVCVTSCFVAIDKGYAGFEWAPPSREDVIAEENVMYRGVYSHQRYNPPFAQRRSSSRNAPVSDSITPPPERSRAAYQNMYSPNRRVIPNYRQEGIGVPPVGMENDFAIEGYPSAPHNEVFLEPVTPEYNDSFMSNVPMQTHGRQNPFNDPMVRRERPSAGIPKYNVSKAPKINLDPMNIYGGNVTGSDFEGFGFSVINGFGDDIPLDIALSQIIPGDYNYKLARGVDKNINVSWQGGEPWNVVLADLLYSQGLDYTINGKQIVVTPSTPFGGEVVMNDYNMQQPGIYDNSTLIPSPVEGKNPRYHDPSFDARQMGAGMNSQVVGRGVWQDSATGNAQYIRRGGVFDGNGEKIPPEEMESFSIDDNRNNKFKYPRRTGEKPNWVERMYISISESFDNFEL